MALPELYQEQEYKRQTFDKDAEFRRLYGVNASNRDARKFKRYWNSDQRVADEAAFNKEQDEAEAAFVQSEIEKRAASWDARIAALKEQNAARGEAALKNINASLAAKPVISPPPLVLKNAAHWNQVASQYGFKDYNAVAAWQKENGLNADGKFGSNSYAKWAELNPDKVGTVPVIKPKPAVITQAKAQTETPVSEVTSIPSGYVELSRQDGSTFLQRIPSKTAPASSTATPKKRNNWFVNATLGAAMADAPAVMTASGWRQNEVGDYVQDREDDHGVERLRNNLAVLGGTATGLTTAGLMTAGAAGTAAIAAPEATPLLTGPAAKHFLYDAAGKLLMTYKQGGTMNRINYFQQGGAAPQQQDIKAQVTALVQAAMQGDKKATETVNKIMEAAKAGDQQAIQIAQMIQQVAQKMQGQATAAKWGSKLNYIRSLKFAKGGKACPECEKG